MFKAIKAWPDRAKASIDGFMGNKLGFSNRQKLLTWHYLRGLWEQVLAIIPISLLQVMGLFLAIIGLTMFLDGLRVAVMPMAELVGEELPKKLHIVFVLMIAGFLGILVTYAEPAIAALRPLGALVDPSEAAVLYLIMNNQTELLILAIGLGVGVAAIIGTLRFIKNWPLKPLIYITLAPTMACACYMQWGDPNLAPVIGMAWDCGGVTTGPVTVPVLLALGIGVMASSRKKRLARAALEGSVAAGAGQALEGFGIVTLASLFPVLAVELMGIIDSLIYPYEEILAKAQEAAANPPAETVVDKPPVSGVVYAVRSIMPLVLALVLIIKLILRQPLPICTVWVEAQVDDDASVKSGKEGDGISRASVAIAKGLTRTESQSTVGDSEGGELSTHDEGSEDGAAADIESASSPAPPPPPAAVPAAAVTPPGTKDIPITTEKAGFGQRLGQWFARTAPLLAGVALAQVGMIAFNEGLTYAFTALGNQVGTTLPAAFLEVPYLPKSPYYSYAGGLILVLVVVFLLGVLATRAEPALNVLGRTVERLSGGNFTSKMLIGAVCVGVGVGMAVGAVKILFNLAIIYFLLGKYFVAIILTIISPDAITAVAWDSAGVTTGPVTVPFVLAIGIGFAQAVGSSEGFGMLTIASVAPIISVLLSNILRKPAKAASRSMSLRARQLSRGFSTFRMRRRLDASPSFAMAAFAADAGGSAGPTPDPSLRGGTANV